MTNITTCQFSAIFLLAKMGWTPLAKTSANAVRNNRMNAVILENITREFLKRQYLHCTGVDAPLSEDNIQDLIARLKALPSETYVKQAESKWDALCLPQYIEQVVDGTKRNLSVNFIDFDNPQNNLYHMVPDFVVEHSKSTDKRKLDIVLFVNGIPLVVIENKKATTQITESVRDTIRNQKPDYIPQLYVYAQVLMSLNQNENRYGTTGTPAKLWNTWRENELGDDFIQDIMDRPLTTDFRKAIFSDNSSSETFLEDVKEGKPINNQDRTLVGMCLPERLLKIIREFIVFDGSFKIIARNHQFDAVRKTLNRIEDDDEPRGGVIWHTQGSGKSLTMMMLARSLIAHSALNDARIIIVTDRVNLDNQIKGFFKNASMDTRRATTGKMLVSLIKDKQAGVITTIINKFEVAARERVKDLSSNIFVLVDEGNRSQSERFNAQMRRVFPNASYIAFIGTPIAKKDKKTMSKYGPLIDTYSTRDAVADGTILPLIYESRPVDSGMNSDALDTWFSRLGKGLSDAQKADLKQKFVHANKIAGFDKVITYRAFDISEHYRANYQGTGLKAQLVASDKRSAVQYKKVLDAIGHVRSEVLIYSRDIKEGDQCIEEKKPADNVVDFWGVMMPQWGSEENYNEGVKGQFKYRDKPEIIIVVNKILTDFDVPRNAVLYLSKYLREHTLLQTFAQVNSVLDTEEVGYATDKDNGYIVDYEETLKDLSDLFSNYEALTGFEEADIKGLLHSIDCELEKVPQAHSALLDIFNQLETNANEEAYEVFLADEELRCVFYRRLKAFAKALSIALGAVTFYDKTSEITIERYKQDLKRFISLRTSVKRRYAEKIDFNDYDKKIEKILNDRAGADHIELAVLPVNIFNLATVEESLKELKTDRAKADFILYSMRRTICERMAENSDLHKNPTEMIDQIIQDSINARYADAVLLKKARKIHDEMVSGGGSNVPESLIDNPLAVAFRGYLLKTVEATDEDITAFAKNASDIFKEHMIVDLFRRPDTLNKIRVELDDYIYDELIGRKGIELTTQHMDNIQDNLIKIAEMRFSK